MKRWDRLLLATAEMKRRKLDFSVELAGDGPLRRSLEQQAHELDISERVKFRGYADDIPALLPTQLF